MKDKEYIENIENILSGLLKPIKNIPFNIVVKSISNNVEVISFNECNDTHNRALEVLKKISQDVIIKTKNQSIISERVNEVGNKIENIVKDSMIENDIKIIRPKSQKNKNVGYPDFEFFIKNDSFYLECKTYNKKSYQSSNRSFFLSPSKDFKVGKSTVHFLLSFEIIKETINDINYYKAISFHIISIEKLQCDLKYEFNSSNKKIYSNNYGAKILFSS